ncbi:MAG: hypothetical protein P8L85_11435 [Rubripirellula sp.]|nr:hypothetical protein [Rubripirellula sp.]
MTNRPEHVSVSLEHLVGPDDLLVVVFAMRFDVRPIFVAFLCIAASLGHSPAWVHVASCEDCASAGSDRVPACEGKGVEVPASNCAHGCDHHHGDLPKQSSKQGGERSDLPHDPDSCATCHSLACPIGFGWTPVSLAISGHATDRGTVFSAFISHQFWVPAAHPRGPPLSA